MGSGTARAAAGCGTCSASGCGIRSPPSAASGRSGCAGKSPYTSLEVLTATFTSPSSASPASRAIFSGSASTSESSSGGRLQRMMRRMRPQRASICASGGSIVSSSLTWATSPRVCAWVSGSSTVFWASAVCTSPGGSLACAFALCAIAPVTCLSFRRVVRDGPAGGSGTCRVISGGGATRCFGV